MLLGFLFLLGSPSPLTLYIGLPIVILGQLINLLTYGVLTKRDMLVTTGPYAWCRNPFYVGTLMTDFGFCIMCNPSKPFVLGILLAYAAVQGTLYYLQMFREEKLLHGIHGDNYEAYCKQARWRLLPSPLSALKHGGFSFRWSARLALHNKIFSRALSAGFWVTAFWALSLSTGSGRSYLLALRDINFRPVFGNTWLLLTATAVTGVYILVRILEWRNRKREETAENAQVATDDAGDDKDIGKVSET